MEKWDAHADVWRDDKEAAVARFCGEPGGSDALVSVGGPTCEAFEKVFARFAKRAEDLYEASRIDRDVSFARVVFKSLGASLREECLAWVAAYAREMDRADAERVRSIRADLKDKKLGVHIACNTLEDLKAVLAIIASVREGHAEMELAYLDIEERYRTRALYGVGASEHDAAEANAT